MNEKIEKYARQKYIDYLKVIAIIFIVFTHDPWSVENAELPLFSLLIDMAVPIFMIVSGFNYAYSSRVKNRNTLKKLYNLDDMMARLLRFLVPFGAMFWGEVILLIVFKNKSYTFSGLMVDMLTGGYGPGAYYTPIMIQFIFIVPFLYIFINRYKGLGLIVIFCINFVFECVYTFWNLSGVCYRLCVIRYIFLIAIGISWHETQLKTQKDIRFVVSFIVGLLYLVGATCFYEPVIFVRWTTTSMISGFYIFPLIILFVRVLEKIDVPYGIERIVLLCSKSTFHIYLFQMVYYYVGVERIFFGLPIWVRLLLNIVICMFAGCVFYGLMTQILKKEESAS